MTTERTGQSDSRIRFLQARSKTLSNDPPLSKLSQLCLLS